MHAPCTVIVLAAGAARAPMQPPHDGTPDAPTVLGSTLHAVLASRLPLAVVVGVDEPAGLAERLVGRDRVVRPTRQRRSGVGDAIAAGVAMHSGASGWLVLPGDLTGVRPDTLLRVADALKTHAVAYPQLRGRRGHPVGFSAELYSELVALSGDEGARRLVARYPARAVEVDDAGVLHEGDAMQDAALLRSVQGGQAPMPVAYAIRRVG